jgi:hypothetical protein
LASIILSWGAVPAKAQLYTGSVARTVSDPSGAVVPAAKVMLVDENKGFSFDPTTNNAGRYLFRAVQPGTYKLSVTAQGFENETRSGVRVDVNQNVAVDFSMKLGRADQSVVVHVEAPVLATQDAVAGQVVDRRFINDFPLNGRGVFDLAFLAPGVTEVDFACVGCSANNFIAIGGQNATADILVDSYFDDPSFGVINGTLDSAHPGAGSGADVLILESGERARRVGEEICIRGS